MPKIKADDLQLGRRFTSQVDGDVDKYIQKTQRMTQRKAVNSVIFDNNNLNSEGEVA